MPMIMVRMVHILTTNIAKNYSRGNGGVGIGGWNSCLLHSLRLKILSF